MRQKNYIKYVHIYVQRRSQHNLNILLPLILKIIFILSMVYKKNFLVLCNSVFYLEQKGLLQLVPFQ
ncbi:hypothetical protein HRU45_02850 [Candidatus Dependentiae bacterium]|nr:hypothetical protein [Candidatus Dependentiae bacterium]